MKAVSTFDEISRMLPAVQAAVKEEIAGRIAAGEAVVGIDSTMEAELAEQKRALIDGPSPYKGKSARKAAAGIGFQRRRSKLSAA